MFGIGSRNRGRLPRRFPRTAGSNFTNYPAGSGIEKIANDLRGDPLFDRALGREGARAGSQKAQLLLPKGGGHSSQVKQIRKMSSSLVEKNLL